MMNETRRRAIQLGVLEWVLRQVLLMLGVEKELLSEYCEEPLAEVEGSLDKGFLHCLYGVLMLYNGRNAECLNLKQQDLMTTSGISIYHEPPSVGTRTYFVVEADESQHSRLGEAIAHLRGMGVSRADRA